MKNNAEKSRKAEKSRTKTPCHVVYALWGKSVPPGNRSRHGTITGAKTRLTSKKIREKYKNHGTKTSVSGKILYEGRRASFQRFIKRCFNG